MGHDAFFFYVKCFMMFCSHAFLTTALHGVWIVNYCLSLGFTGCCFTSLEGQWWGEARAPESAWPAGRWVGGGWCRSLWGRLP